MAISSWKKPIWSKQILHNLYDLDTYFVKRIDMIWELLRFQQG